MLFTSLIGQIIAQISHDPHPGGIRGSMPFLEMRGPVWDDRAQKTKPAPKADAPDSATPSKGNSGSVPTKTDPRPNC